MCLTVRPAGKGIRVTRVGQKPHVGHVPAESGCFPVQRLLRGQVDLQGLLRATHAEALAGGPPDSDFLGHVLQHEPSPPPSLPSDFSRQAWEGGTT